MPMSESTLKELRDEALSWERTAARCRLSFKLHRGSDQQRFNIRETANEAVRNAKAIRKVIFIGGEE